VVIHTVFVSTGSNMGNKLENCRRGIAGLEKSGKSVVKELSDFYKTEPVDYTDQDWFVNAVARIETKLDPAGLLCEIKTIQREIGRTEGPVRFGPRIIDLDILIFDDLVFNLPGLVIPHPRMHRRAFVLKPICDIDPMIIHPVLGKSMKYLLDNLDDKGQGILPY